MDILLTNTYFYRLDPKQWRAAQPYPPLNTLFAASWLRKNGYQVEIFDNSLQPDSSSLEKYLPVASPSYFVIVDDGFNYLTKMCLTVMREAAFQMLGAARSLGIPSIIYSSDATDHAPDYHHAGADFVVHGESEITLSDLLDTLENKKSIERVRGISFVRDQLVKTGQRPVLQDLDTLPMPAWDMIDLQPYCKLWKAAHGYFSLNIATTRGCPFKCNWCAKPMYGNRYNSRSPEQVVSEMEYLINNYHPDHFWICDDIFGLKPKWVQQFDSLVQRKKLKFRYKIQSRVDLLLKDDTMQALASSGLETVWVGAESGSQKILDAMDKGTKVDQIYSATQLAKQHGIRVAFFLQFGYLNESMEDIKKTINMVMDLMPDEIGISVSYPLPGTKFYEIVKSELDKKSNWIDSSDLDLMFKNTYSSQFYKTLHRFVHSKHRAKRGKKALLSLLRFSSSSMKASLRQIVSGAFHSLRVLFLHPRLTKLSKISRHG